MNAATDLSFATPNLHGQLAQLSQEQLDRLDFGVIGFDGETNVCKYNQTESEAAGLRAAAEGGDPQVLAVVAQVLGRVRKAKSEAKVKQRTAVTSAVISGPAAQLEQLRAGLEDLQAAGNAADLTLTDAEGELAVSDVQLEEAPQA